MDDAVLSVRQLTDQIRRNLEQSFPFIHVEGEVSNFRMSANDHWYFSLKDSEALIQVVMFRGDTARAATVPADGDMVRVSGSVGVYGKRGTYQIVCRSLAPAGRGELLLLLERRKQEFAQRGYFDPERKKQIPYFPQTVAVVTSPTGAAIRDILHVIGRRNARLNVVVLPTPVQGDTAAELIARRIETANLFHLGDVIIVTRGGGSLEDLLPFSDERVVRAIYDSKTPVVSAVGHETDIPLCDLVADVRAPTPSAAAEVVSAAGEEVHRRIEAAGRSVVTSYLTNLNRVWDRVRRFSREELAYRYRNYVQPWYQRLDEAKESALANLRDRYQLLDHRFQLTRERLAGADPRAPLGRGFAIVHGPDDQIVESADALVPELSVAVEFQDGTWDMRTTSRRSCPGSDGAEGVSQVHLPETNRPKSAGPNEKGAHPEEP